MDSEHTSPTERLWTPWRMRYIGGSSREDGCIFCNRLEADHDLGSLILYRGQHTFVIMNLFPYNTGHIMMVPNQHASDPEQMSPEALREMGETLPLLTTTLRRVLGCDGFNVGLNIGTVAGAGVAAHLHQHVVPRWIGDANFMPIMASTMVIPETIPVTYAKIRAEIDREVSGTTLAEFVLLDPSGEKALLYDGHIASVQLEEDVPVWKSLIDAIPDGITDLELAGWAGSESTRDITSDRISVTLRGTVDSDLPEGWASFLLNDDRHDERTRARLSRAHAQLAPAI